MGADGARAVAEALKASAYFILFRGRLFCRHKYHAQVNTTLATLNLRYNDIGAEGACAVAEMLKVRPIYA